MHDHLDNQGVFLEENKRFHDVIAHGSGNMLFGLLVDALLGILDGSAIGIDYPEKQACGCAQGPLEDLQSNCIS